MDNSLYLHLDHTVPIGPLQPRPLLALLKRFTLELLVFPFLPHIGRDVYFDRPERHG